MPTAVKLPELGEGIEQGTVTRVLVAVGDVVEVDQPLIELETDKAVVEVPSSAAGTVKAVRVKENGTINVGDPIVELEEDGKAAAAKPKEKPAKDTKEEKAAEAPKEKAKAKVKDEPAAAETSEEAGDALEEDQEDVEAREVKVEKAERTPAAKKPAAQAAPSEDEEEAGDRARRVVMASPSVRRLAREIGVDISLVEGAGPGGRISEDDVKSFARAINTEITEVVSRARGQEPLPNFERWGHVRSEAMSNVRRKTAEHMTLCWETIPHVTQFDKADVTELEDMRKRHGQRVEGQGGKLTITAFILKVLASALKKFPQFNASIDMSSHEVFYKEYYNIGVAVDTDRGLLVPVVRNVDAKNLTELAVELAELAERARTRKIALDDMQGGTFTVTNLGGIGGTAFTPIINAPEVAILGISRAVAEPVVENGEFQPRLMLPLSLSYDHRIIDGADAARFLRWVVEALEQPFLLFLEG
jgi:pyruvate dehydrogenase E2 component (dihydrolipoamide acetyltransferase)